MDDGQTLSERFCEGLLATVAEAWGGTHVRRQAHVRGHDVALPIASLAHGLRVAIGDESVVAARLQLDDHSSPATATVFVATSGRFIHGEVQVHNLWGGGQESSEALIASWGWQRLSGVTVKVASTHAPDRDEVDRPVEVSLDLSFANGPTVELRDELYRPAKRVGEFAVLTVPTAVKIATASVAAPMEPDPVQVA